MKYVVLILMLLCFLNSCQKDSPKIYIKTSTISGFPKMEKRDTTTEVTMEYFEIGLYSYESGNHFTTRKELENVIDLEHPQNSKSKYFEIVENDSLKSFTSSTEFINYMLERGYEMVDQSKLRHHTDYTFRSTHKKTQ